MIIKTRKQIERDMIQWSRNNNSSLTDFNQGSVIRSIYSAVAAILAQIYYQLHRLYRSARIVFADGGELDILLAARGMSRRGATKASLRDVTISADEGTVIPVGYKAGTENGIEFVTIETGTVAANEVSIDLDCEAVIPGIGGTIREGTLIKDLTNQTGVNSIFNSTNSEGGFDSETDEMFRNRGIEQLDALSLGVPASYQAWAREARSDVFRAIAQANNPAWGDKVVVVYLVQDNAGAFSEEDLNQVEHYIQAKAPLGAIVKCLNAVWTDVNLTVQVRLTKGVNLNDVKENITVNMKLYLDYREWEWGTDVDWSDLFALISNTLGVDEVEKAGFIPGSNVIVGAQSLPRFATINITEW